MFPAKEKLKIGKMEAQMTQFFKIVFESTDDNTQYNFVFLH